MSDHPDNTDLRRRLTSFEERFARVMRHFGSRGPLPEHHRAKVDEFEDKKAALRARLAIEGDFQTHPINTHAKSVIEREIENLMNSFERWVEHVDQEFNQAFRPPDVRMQAKDIMTTEVVTVDPELDVASVAKLLLDHHISGAPVVDREGSVVGIISEGDLMRRAECNRGRSWWLSLLADRTGEFIHVHETRAQDVMTRKVVSIGEETAISEAARILEANYIKRVPVIDEGHLVGLVSRADILRGLAACNSANASRPTIGDREVRARILELIRQETGASTQSISVIAVNREVYLWGIVDNDRDKDAIRVAAESVAGANNVHNFLNAFVAR